MKNQSTIWPETATGWTLFVFGILASAAGITGLISPDTQLEMMGFEIVSNRAKGDYTTAVLASTSIAASYTGVLYILGAYKKWPWFAAFTVGASMFMCVGFIIMLCNGKAPASFAGAAVWEGAGATITALAMLWDNRKKRS